MGPDPVPKSIVGGIEENNEVYICRCWTGGQLVPGKFMPWRGNCVVEWQGTVDCTAGQVLVYQECEGLNCPNDHPAKCEHNCPNEWTAARVLLLNKASPTGEKEERIWLVYRNIDISLLLSPIFSQNFKHTFKHFKQSWPNDWICKLYHNLRCNGTYLRCNGSHTLF